jgi:small subunit ribosomal protein S8
MSMNDTISDMLTRIRNAIMAKKAEVLVPFSNFKNSLATVLVEEGWISSAKIKEEGSMKNILITLKYSSAGDPVISGIKRVSKPGQRIYSKIDKIPRVRGGMGVTILSTPQGLMSDKNARSKRVGGEVICQIW